MFAFAHGAGAGIRHPFMRDMARRLAGRGIASLRYNFPYMEAARDAPRRRPPDSAGVLARAVRQAAAKAKELAQGLPLFAGGKSMGGRMTSLAHSEEPLAGVRGIIFFGFPLHPPRQSERAAERSAHLARVSCPMLFLQGTRDALAHNELIEELRASLSPRATLCALESADHAFVPLKRSGRTAPDIHEEAARAASEWIAKVVRGQGPPSKP